MMATNPSGPQLPESGSPAPTMYLPVRGFLPESGPTSGPTGDLGLPFDPRTLIRSVLRKWKWALLWAVLSAGVGIGAGLLMGSRTYTAETVLLHRHQPSAWTGLDSAPMDSLSLNTKLHLVKVQSNLEETRRRLKLEATIPQLGSAVDAISEKNADLMIIRAEWGSPQVAAALANTVAEVFFQSQVRIRYREELAVVERMWKEEQASANRLRAQIDDLSRMTSDLRRRIDVEMKDSPAEEGLGQLNIRISQLRDAIYDDQQQRANSALLKQRETQLERARELLGQGMLTQSEFETVEAEYHRLEALTVDTDQVAKWREELEELQGVVLPSDDNTTASAPLLQAVMLKGLDAEFELADARERASQLLNVRLELQGKMTELEADTLHAAGGELAPWMADSDFRVITPASVPSMPTLSNRRLVAGGSFAFLLLLGAVVLVGWELLPMGFRSGPEMALRLKVPALGVTPRGTRKDPGPETPTPLQPEAMRLLAQRILEGAPKHGARILITSPNHGEGRTALTAGAALALSEMGEKVLVVDGSRGVVRREPGNGPEARTAGGPPGIARILDRLKSRWQTHAPGAEYSSVPLQRRFEEAGVGYLELGSSDAYPKQSVTGLMESLLENSGGDYRLILVDGPPVLPDATAQRLAGSMDSVVLAVRSSSTTGGSAKRAMSRLSGSGTRLMGAVLTDVDPVFVDLE